MKKYSVLLVHSPDTTKTKIDTLKMRLSGVEFYQIDMSSDIEKQISDILVQDAIANCECCYVLVGYCVDEELIRSIAKMHGLNNVIISNSYSQWILFDENDAKDDDGKLSAVINEIKYNL